VSSVSLAVQHRPRRFADVVGQRHAVAVLRAGLASGRLPQQVLLAGPSGTGKTTLARLVAAALACATPMAERDNAEVCGVCDNCRDIFDPRTLHPDVVEFDAASHGSIDAIRDIATKASLAPLRSAVRVYVIDEAHGISGAGAEAFLKLYEEPPAHTFFLLATTVPDKLLATLRSRSLQLNLALPTGAQLGDNLNRIAAAEGWQLPGWLSELVLEASDPQLGVRGTVMTLSKLAPLLSGAEPDPATVADALGVAPAQLVSPLTAAIDRLDRRTAFAALDAARAQVADDALRTALRSWARQKLRRAVGDGAAVAKAAWQLEQLLVAPYGEVGTDLAVARCTMPELAGDPASLAALVDTARKLTDQLRGATPNVTPPPQVPPPTVPSGSLRDRVLDQLRRDQLGWVAELGEVFERDDQVVLRIRQADADQVRPHVARLASLPQRCGVAVAFELAG
jgi:DNA polymerase III subunit gamma/tau